MHKAKMTKKKKLKWNNDQKNIIKDEIAPRRFLHLHYRALYFSVFWCLGWRMKNEELVWQFSVISDEFHSDEGLTLETSDL